MTKSTSRAKAMKKASSGERRMAVEEVEREAEARTVGRDENAAMRPRRRPSSTSAVRASTQRKTAPRARTPVRRFVSSSSCIFNGLSCAYTP
jgi:hypothetical protein